MKIEYELNDTELQSKPELLDYASFKLGGALNQAKSYVGLVTIHMHKTSDAKKYYCSVKMIVLGQNTVIETSIKENYYQAIDDVTIKAALRARHLVKRHRSLSMRHRILNRDGQPSVKLTPLDLELRAILKHMK